MPLAAIGEQAHKRGLATGEIVVGDDVADEPAVVGIEIENLLPIPIARAACDLRANVDRRPTMRAHLHRQEAVEFAADTRPEAVLLARFDLSPAFVAAVALARPAFSAVDFGCSRIILGIETHFVSLLWCSWCVRFFGEGRDGHSARTS